MAMTTEAPLPFLPAELRFGSVIEQKFVKPAMIWMLGQKGSQILSSVPRTCVEQSSCWWGMALYLESFVNAQQMQDLFVLSERAVLAEQAIQLSKTLLENQNGNGSWDNVTWDTSTICRSLLLLVESSKTNNQLKVPTELASAIIQSVRKALEWLIVQTAHWESVRYPFGPEDLAMILRLVCVAERTSLQVFPDDVASRVDPVRAHLVPKNIQEFVEQLIDRLVRVKVFIDRGPAQPPYVHWETPFSTAHTMQAFAEALYLLPAGMKDQCISDMAGAVAYVEETQDEGRWGMPNSTSLMLQAYVTACDAISHHGKLSSYSVNPVPEIVFKSLRWLADEKQRFSDGSILHTFTHTSFFVLMLQHLILSRSYLLDFPVIQLYDYVIWDSQVRSSHERSERLRLTEKYIHRGQDLQDLTRFHNTIITLSRGLIVVFATIILAMVFSSLGLMGISLQPFSINIPQPEVLLAAVGLFVPVVSAFWYFSRRWLKGDDSPEVQKRQSDR